MKIKILSYKAELCPTISFNTHTAGKINIPQSPVLTIRLLSEDIDLTFQGCSKDYPKIDNESKSLIVFTKKKLSRLTEYMFSSIKGVRCTLKDTHFKVRVLCTIENALYDIEGEMTIESPEKELQFLLKQIPLYRK